MSEQGVTKTIYLIRHGQTIGNTDKIVYEPKDDILNGVGRQEASLQGERLRDVRFDKLITSEYPRTIETASLILSHNNKNKSPPARQDTRLREIDLPNSYGKPYISILQKLIVFLESGKPIEEFQFDGSETVPEIRQRTRSFVADLIEDICSTEQEEAILVVSHGACIRFLMEAVSNEEEFDIKNWDSEYGLKIMRNTSCHKMQITKPSGGNKKVEVKFEQLHDCNHIPKHMFENDALTRMVNTPETKCLSGCFQV